MEVTTLVTLKTIYTMEEESYAKEANVKPIATKEHGRTTKGMGSSKW